MSHICHALNCDKQVPPKLFMCRKHWYMVPRILRAEVWRHYRPGQEIDKQPTEKYLKVTAEAITAVAKGELK